MLESKSMQVSVSEEQECIENMQCFGWTCLSSQEINSKESHQELHGDTLYSVTTKENYVKLLFQRDTKHPNYSELVRCENTYNSILKSKPYGPRFNGTAAFVGLLFFVLPCVIYVIMYLKKKKDYNASFDAWYKRWTNEALPAKERAKSLA